MRYLGLAAWLANVVLVLASWFCSVPIWLYAVLFVEKIPRAKLLMYSQWGHGLYEEAKDFNRVVMEFLNT